LFIDITPETGAAGPFDEDEKALPAGHQAPY
jgi:hypothetical protein